jgi:hypothetical protein
MLAKQVHYGCAADTLTHVLMVLVGLFWCNSACTVSADQHRCTTAGVLPSTENVKHARTKCNAEEHKTCSQDLTQQQWCRAFLLHPQATTSSSHYGMPQHATPCHTNRQQALVPTSPPPPPPHLLPPSPPPPPSALPPPPPSPQKAITPPPSQPASQCCCCAPIDSHL